MGVASLDGVPFRLDPSEVAWDFTIKTKTLPTVGGKVIQVFGTKLGNMTVNGEFGQGGWQAQAAFLERIRAIGARQANLGAQVPVRFRLPQHGWDFQVFLNSFTNRDGGSSSVRQAAGIFAPTWSLNFTIAEDHTAGLKEAATELFIRRISKGMGWKPSVYSGPMGWDEVMETVAPYSLQEYLITQFDPGVAAAVGATIDQGGDGGGGAAPGSNIIGTF